MARKIKFALEMADGYKVRNSIEELREHFNIDNIASYYLSGKLQEWLEDRYYEEEANKIAELDRESAELHNQICIILGVEPINSEKIDIESLERINEKKSILRQKTSDSSIIENASITALSQEDLANLLDADEPVIYLMGEKFNIPIRKANKKYIGILGKPLIKIQAKKAADLEGKNIIFENVLLPWTPKEHEATPIIPIASPTEAISTSPPPSINETISDAEDLTEEFIEVFNSIFTSWNQKNNNIWEVTNIYGTDCGEKLTAGKKNIAICTN